MKRIRLANLPTKIYRLERLSNELGANIYIKRDDQTGSELTGNKVRKLEFEVADAIEQGCDMLITCGGIQSNHCRATVAAATLMCMKSAVLLRISDEPPVRGNYFLDRLLGADVRFCTKDEYRNYRQEIMEEMAEKYRKQGHKPYIIPEGASNAIGTLGYYTCMQEILEQEKQMGITFNTIVVATGSGGTIAGLHLANELGKLGKRCIGMAVCDDIKYFTDIADRISNEAKPLLKEFLDTEDYSNAVLLRDNIEINDKYVGIGYALSRPEELEFIRKIARLEGLILDPVYTGKAMYGLWNELQKNADPKTAINPEDNVLFIHTGGLFGLFPISDTFPL
ncbi:MAG: D-cysteine desulfhydrase family protein [Bacteroidales bacterium]|nr:D-cysteine desulfhydrase family protein [Bacteroidales bacterium]MBP5518097.1 D-cysteine desulfhydrase family protein [Bacteroidales bacterium]